MKNDDDKNPIHLYTYSISQLFLWLLRMDESNFCRCGNVTEKLFCGFYRCQEVTVTLWLLYNSGFPKLYLYVILKKHINRLDIQIALEKVGLKHYLYVHVYKILLVIR